MEHSRTTFYFNIKTIDWKVDYQLVEISWNAYVRKVMKCEIYKNDNLYHTFENQSPSHVNKTQANRLISKAKKENVREDTIDKLLK